MICPNCDFEMKNKSYNYYSIGEWDTDYPHALHEEYYCKNCRIKFLNGEWIIPKKFERPTDKQIKTVLLIKNRLPQTSDFEPLLKTQVNKFIGNNLPIINSSYYR